MKDPSKIDWYSWGKSIFIALGIAMMIRTFFLTPYIVEGASMEPTLLDQEKVLVNKFNFANHLTRGEIVIIKGEEENYVKRVIGLPGDTIVMKNDHLYINGALFKEPYLAQNRKLAKQIGSLRLTGDFGPIRVPKDKIFVLGDNRLISRDSRNGLGYIRMDHIIGQGEAVFSPIPHIRSIN